MAFFSVVVITFLWLILDAIRGSSSDNKCANTKQHEPWELL